jgi:hypothetical protein
MRIRHVVILVAVASMLGCTSDKLKRTTVNQGRTLTEIQYAQVLTNLAMFCSSSEFVPSFVNLNDGSCQIADLGSAQYLGDWHKAIKSQPSILGSRTVVEQWGMTPVTDDNELQVLQIAFRRAVGIDESLEDHRDLANDIAHELVNQLPDVDDYRGTILNQFEDFKNEERRRSDAQRARNFLGMTADPMGRVLSFMYPVSSTLSHSLYDDFSDQTISSVDYKIIYDNEFLRYLNVWGSYADIVTYNHRYFYVNYRDYVYDLKSHETKTKLRLPPPAANPGYELQVTDKTSGIPAQGEGLIVVALEGGMFHFRVFDDAGGISLDTDETRMTNPQLTNLNAQRQRLVQRVDNRWPPYELSASEKYEITAIVDTIFKLSLHGHTYHVESDSAAVKGSKVVYVTPESAAVRRQIRDLENDLLSIPADRAWFEQGKKHDVPKDACFVGHYGDCYVWVRPDGLKELSNLTIKTLKFANLVKSGTVMTIPGPRYTPSSGFPSL